MYICLCSLCFRALRSSKRKVYAAPLIYVQSRMIISEEIEKLSLVTAWLISMGWEEELGDSLGFVKLMTHTERICGFKQINWLDL